MPATTTLSPRHFQAWRRSSSTPAIHTNSITDHQAMPFSASVTCGENTKAW